MPFIPRRGAGRAQQMPSCGHYRSGRTARRQRDLFVTERPALPCPTTTALLGSLSPVAAPRSSATARALAASIRHFHACTPPRRHPPPWVDTRPQAHAPPGHNLPLSSSPLPDAGTPDLRPASNASDMAGLTPHQRNHCIVRCGAGKNSLSPNPGLAGQPSRIWWRRLRLRPGGRRALWRDSSVCQHQ